MKLTKLGHVSSVFGTFFGFLCVQSTYDIIRKSYLEEMNHKLGWLWTAQRHRSKACAPSHNITQRVRDMIMNVGSTAFWFMRIFGKKIVRSCGPTQIDVSPRRRVSIYDLSEIMGTWCWFNGEEDVFNALREKAKTNQRRGGFYIASSSFERRYPLHVSLLQCISIASKKLHFTASIQLHEIPLGHHANTGLINTWVVHTRMCRAAA